MSDTYQAIYDAVRSKIGNGDIGSAVEMAIRDANISHYVAMAANAIQCAAAEYQRPSILLRPKISIDGTQWCALYGENLNDGVAGFGNSPAEAMFAFDLEFYKTLLGKEAA